MSSMQASSIAENSLLTLTCTTDEANPTAVEQWASNGASVNRYLSDVQKYVMSTLGIGISADKTFNAAEYQRA